jgi:uncharacterized protein YdeI (YjbR/CyaY-like superfamily)
MLRCRGGNGWLKRDEIALGARLRRSRFAILAGTDEEQHTEVFWKPMASAQTKIFTVPLEATGTSLRWVIARVPVDLKKAWPEWRTRRVRGEINGFPFRTSLFPGPNGVGHALVVNKKMQAGANAKAGQKVKIRLEPDLEERAILIPEELARILKAERGLRKWYDKLTPSMRRDIGRWVGEPKSQLSRERRAEQMAERLMLVMEGEEEPPPMLRAAFQLQPLASKGWNAMTPARRRNHLISIFYRQTTEGRERRVAEAIEDAMTVAKRSREI